MEKIAIVTTSIGSENVFKHFFKEYAKIDISNLSIKLIVVGDLNSPIIDFSKLDEYKEFISKGFEFEYIDVEKQKEIMNSNVYMKDLIPWRRVQRRNIGYLRAYNEGYDFIITVDDDNFPKNRDFVKSHIKNLKEKENVLTIFLSDVESKKWFNPCAFLENHIVHRGFPLNQRYKYKNTIKKIENIAKRIVVSAGFWEGDPDIDALTRLEGNPKNTKIENIQVDNFCIAQDVISPFNTQNTAFRKEIIPALFLSSKNGRYDDIWASYFLKALLFVTGDLVMYGHPLVRQDRNEQDVVKNLEDEIFGMRHTEEFVDELFSFVEENKDSLRGKDYLQLTKEVAKALLEKSNKFNWYYLDILRWVWLFD